MVASLLRFLRLVAFFALTIVAAYLLKFLRAFFRAIERESIRVGTPKNEFVVIPNSNILNSDVIHYSQLAKTEGLLLHANIQDVFNEHGVQIMSPA